MSRRWAGVMGMVIAMVAVAATIVAEHVLPEPPKPAMQATVNLKIGRLDFGWRSKTEEPTPPPPPPPLFSRDRVRTAGTVLGALALPLAVVSWARGERAWWGVGVCCFAVAAIAWQTVVIVFALLVLSGTVFALVPAGTGSDPA